MMRYGFMWGVLLVLLVACGEDPAPNAGDPLPNVRAGMLALYSGDLEGVDLYFTDEIVLWARGFANNAALGNGRIDLEKASFAIFTKQTDDLWTVAMEGEYAIWLYEQEEKHNTVEEGTVYIGIKIEDGIWKINAFGTSEQP